MCNQLHDDFEKIKSEGYGYKIFGKNDTPCFRHKQQYFTKNNWAIWEMGNDGEGFCFFISKKEANRVLKVLMKGDNYKNHYIKRIKYKQGLGKHIENNITIEGKRYIIAICQKFKILELVEVK